VTDSPPPASSGAAPGAAQTAQAAAPGAAQTAAPTDPSLLLRVTGVLAPAYVVENEIGRGGMGIVYRARDARLKRDVAVKLLPPELAFRQEIRSRFLREAEMAAQLSHPNIVPIYTVDERDGLVYFVMAFVDGETLGARLNSRGRLAVDQVRRVMRQVADALAYAHAKGVIHRDIKPDNILLAADSDRAIVTDFGIARAVDDAPTDPSGVGVGTRLTATGVAMGTPAYMSPEQCAGDRTLDGRSDLYALGVLGYHMLTGAPPFLGGNSASILVKQITEQPTPVSARRPDVPADLAAIIMRLLQKNPADRFPDAAALIRALDGEPMPAQAPAAPQPYPSPSTGRPVPPPVSMYAGDASLGMRPAGIPVPPAKLDPQVRLLNRATKYRAGIASLSGTLGMLTVLNLMTSPHHLWVQWPAFGMGWAMIAMTMRVWSAGLNPFVIMTRGPHAALPPDYALPGGGERVASRLVSPDVLAGPFGEVVRRATGDHASILASVAAMGPIERKQIPDVIPTANALVEKIVAMATALHRLDIETPESLRPQFADHRVDLAAQLDRASVVLKGLALDLVRYRAGGVESALGSVTSATQQATALSREIGYALSAADELRTDTRR
jgi:serine/threonine protein kinase